MIDSFVVLAPLLLLPVVALVAFVGCDSLFGLDRVPDVTDAPTGLMAVPGNNKVALSWDPVDDVAGYVVKRGEMSGNYTVSFSPTSNTSLTDTSAVNGTTYYYVVIARGSNSTDSPPSAEVTATPQAAALIPFVTPVMLTTTARVDGWYGMAIQVVGNDLTVIELGRIVVPGNTQIHIVKIVDSEGNDLPNKFVAVNLAGGAAGSFVYMPLASPATLTAGETYYIVSQEMATGDEFYNHTSTVMTTDVAVLTSAARGGPPYMTDSSTNKPYGIVNFRY